MKDVELAAQLLLLIEEGGAKGISKDELDKAHSDRDLEWDEKEEVIEVFKNNIRIISEILNNDNDNVLVRSRLKNQADFYSLFDAVNELSIEEELPDTPTVIERLKGFIAAIDSEEDRAQNEDLENYFFYTQSGVNRTAARETRGEIMRKFILGEN